MQRCVARLASVLCQGSAAEQRLPACLLRLEQIRRFASALLALKALGQAPLVSPSDIV